MPFDGLLRNPGFFPRVAQRRLVARPFAPHAGLPFGHVAGFGGVEAEAEAEAGPAAGGEDAGDQDFVAGGAADGVDVDVR